MRSRTGARGPGFWRLARAAARPAPRAAAGFPRRAVPAARRGKPLYRRRPRFAADGVTMPAHCKVANGAGSICF